VAAQDFVGQGWAFPPRVSASGGIALVRRERELEEAMRIILMTYPGERPMRPGFGCRLRDFVYRNADELTAAELSQEVRQSLAQWEPRVTITQVDVKPDSYQRNMLLIDIQYMIKDENDRRNLVFPFYSIPDDGSDY